MFVIEFHSVVLVVMVILVWLMEIFVINIDYCIKVNIILIESTKKADKLSVKIS